LSWGENARLPRNVKTGQPSLYVGGATVGVVPTIGGLAHSATGGAYGVTGDPFATSTCSYLWAESGSVLSASGGVVSCSRSDALSANEAGALQIRITAAGEVLIVRAQQAVVLTGSGARSHGRFNANAVSVAGNNGRHFIAGNGKTIATSTPTSTYTHGVSGICAGPTAETLQWVSGLHYLAFAPVVVPDAVLLELTANPWRLFQPRRIYIPTATAAASTYTLSAATYVPGSLTATGVTPRVTVTVA
jgi:hypothetical protein